MSRNGSGHTRRSAGSDTERGGSDADRSTSAFDVLSGEYQTSSMLFPRCAVSRCAAPSLPNISSWDRLLQAILTPRVSCRLRQEGEMYAYGGACCRKEEQGMVGDDGG